MGFYQRKACRCSIKKAWSECRWFAEMVNHCVQLWTMRGTSVFSFESVMFVENWPNSSHCRRVVEPGGTSIHGRGHFDPGDLGLLAEDSPETSATKSNHLWHLIFLEVEPLKKVPAARHVRHDCRYLRISDIFSVFGACLDRHKLVVRISTLNRIVYWDVWKNILLWIYRTYRTYYPICLGRWTISPVIVSVFVEQKDKPCWNDQSFPQIIQCSNRSQPPQKKIAKSVKLQNSHNQIIMFFPFPFGGSYLVHNITGRHSRMRRLRHSAECLWQVQRLGIGPQLSHSHQGALWPLTDGAGPSVTL